MNNELEPWAEKCMNCKHVYKKKDDADYLYCRLRKGCKYEPVNNGGNTREEQSNGQK